MANRVRSKSKERYWRDQVLAWQQSGVTIRQYCLQHQLSEPSFYAWRRELARRHEAAGASISPVPRPSPTARVRLPPRAQQASITWMPVTVTSAVAPLVEVQLPSGTVLRVPAGIESQTLERILTALHQATSVQESRP